MKVLLDIKDGKAEHLMAVLHELPYVKVQAITDEKALLVSEIREAVQELKMIKSGKKTARNADDFLNELQG